MTPLTRKYRARLEGLRRAAEAHPGKTVAAYQAWLKMLVTPGARNATEKQPVNG
mgnify:CR=1 FL=1